MNKCTNCNSPITDPAAKYCSVCGCAVLENGEVKQDQGASAWKRSFTANEFDHSHEFSSQDISENKVYCMMVYLMGTLGIIVALLAGRESAYLQFHVRQAMKLEVAATLGGFVSLAATFLFGILLLPFVGLLISAVLLVLPLVLKVICFFQICQGRAVEPAVIRNLKFMR